jgi:hypothetical protein
LCGVTQICAMTAGPEIAPPVSEAGTLPTTVWRMSSQCPSQDRSLSPCAASSSSHSCSNCSQPSSSRR